MEATGTLARVDASVTITFVRTVAATPEASFRALVDPALLERWLAAATLEAVVGGGVHLVWPGEGEMRGVVTDVADARVLEYSWSEGDADAAPSLVRWELEPTDGATTLRLVHAGAAESDAVGLAAGWQSHLEALDEVLAGRSMDRAQRDARCDELVPAYRALLDGA